MTSELINKPLLSVAFCLLFVSGCARWVTEPPSEPAAVLVKVSASETPFFSDDMDYDGLANGIEQSLQYLRKRPSGTSYLFGEDTYSAAHMITSLERFRDYIQQRPPPSRLNLFLASHYRVYRSVGSNGKGHVLFTGYYEPYLQGRLTRSEEFRYPVYARPKDLTTIDLSLFSPDFEGKQLIGRVRNRQMVPYDDRHQIDYEGSLTGKAEVLAWVKDPVDLFFLQIQGSGKIFVEKANPINVHYHTTNGRPYRSIGKLLLKEGKIPKARMSMQSIRDYLARNPEEIKRIFSYNPSYVFFKIEKEGPLGYLDVRLTPGRSLALDRRIFPLAALAFIETQKPLINGDDRIDRWTKLSRFVLNQDTGGAIRGPGRADLFWGDGPYAALAAGHMQHEGRVYFLVLKPDGI